jgi:hypothetical protein
MLVSSNRKSNSQGDALSRSIPEPKVHGGASIGELHGPCVENVFGGHAGEFVS